MQQNILHVYKSYADAALDFDILCQRMETFGVHFRAYPFDYRLRAIDPCDNVVWNYMFHVCNSKRQVMRYSGMALHTVVFHPQESDYDEVVVQYLKSLVRQPV